MNNQEIYQHRFNPDIVLRIKIWEILCKNFFQRKIPDQAIILEIGAGYCDFINNIQGKRKIALDINPDVMKYASSDVEVILCQSDKIDAIDSKTVDVIFISNFFEHIERSAIVNTLQEAFQTLNPGGKVIILQPNIRFTYRDYWMFFDHITPIDDRALVEVLEVKNIKIIAQITRFLPYSTKSFLPKSAILIRLYLVLKFLWPLFGKQSLLIAEKPLS